MGHSVLCQMEEGGGGVMCFLTTTFSNAPAHPPPIPHPPALFDKSLSYANLANPLNAEIALTQSYSYGKNRLCSTLCHFSFRYEGVNSQHIDNNEQ